MVITYNNGEEIERYVNLRGVQKVIDGYPIIIAQNVREEI